MVYNYFCLIFLDLISGHNEFLLHPKFHRCEGQFVSGEGIIRPEKCQARCPTKFQACVESSEGRVLGYIPRIIINSLSLPFPYPSI